MSIKRIVTCGLAAMSPLLAACGGASPPSTRTSAGTAGADRPSHKFVVRLTGQAESPVGAPRGVGVAVIALHDARQAICWRFAHLHGFSSPTRAEIHLGPQHRTGPVVLALSTAPPLHHRGCAPARRSLMAGIAQHPGNYYINVDTTRHRSGAVRGQL